MHSPSICSHLYRMLGQSFCIYLVCKVPYRNAQPVSITANENASDPVFTGLTNGNVEGLYGTSNGTSRLRQGNVNALLLHKICRHHKKDQQQKDHVDQWGNLNTSLSTRSA
jgi:hypothetical protein